MDENRAERLAAIVTQLVDLIAENQPAEVPVPRRAPEHTLLTVEEAADRLRIGRTRMFALVKSGEVESVLIGRLRRIPCRAVTSYADHLRDAHCKGDDQ